MTAVRNIQFAPAGHSAQQQKRSRREKGTYTLLDNPVIEYCKRVHNASASVLIVLAQRANMKKLAQAMTEAELAVACGLGISAVVKNLKLLKEAGLAVKSKAGWKYLSSESADESVDNCVDNYPKNPSKNAARDEVSTPLKEVRRNLEGKKETTTTTKPNRSVGVPNEVVGVVGGASQKEKNITLSSQEKNKSQDQGGGAQQTTSFRDVPPAAPPAASYREAMGALQAAGAWDIWHNWVLTIPRLAQNHGAQNAQVAQFAEWVKAGLMDRLRRDAAEIAAAGSFLHPFSALKKRMERAWAKKQECHTTVPKSIQGEPQCQSGERRRAPDGQIWTVERVDVKYGIVVFEEAEAPHQIPDPVAASWEVIA